MGNTEHVPAQFSSWMDVNVDTLLANFEHITERVSPSKVIAVIKANALGHGMRMVGLTLQEAGAFMLGVSNFMEAIDLRKNGITIGILVMNGLLPEQMKAAIEHDVSFFVFDGGSAKAANAYAASLGKKARVHLKVDTGMGRLGILPDQASEFASTISGLDSLHIEGIASHLASPYVPEHDWFSKRQYELFVKAARILDPEHRALWNLAASSGVLRFPETYLDAVRFQTILYGLSRVWPIPWPLKPVAQYKSRVVQVKALPEGHNVGYMLHHTVSRETKLAIVPVGTADALTPAHASTGTVLIGGQKCRILGICSCEMMVDVTDTNGVGVGDEVVMFGRQGEHYVYAHEFAASGESSHTNILTRIPPRVPRVYWKGGRVVATETYCELTRV